MTNRSSTDTGATPTIHRTDDSEKMYAVCECGWNGAVPKIICGFMTAAQRMNRKIAGHVGGCKLHKGAKNG